MKSDCTWSASRGEPLAERIALRSLRAMAARRVLALLALALLVAAAAPVAAQQASPAPQPPRIFTEPVLIELVKILPSALWLVVAIIVVLIFYRPIKNQLLPLVTGLKIGGIECSFVREAIQASVALARKHGNWQVEVSEEDASLAMDRASRHLGLLQKAKILWVDDVPENNFNEIKMLHQLRADVETAHGTDEALERLAKQPFDIILSDLKRGDDAGAGLAMLNRLKDSRPALPVIFYVGEFDPARGVPPFAFGLTNRPDEMLHLILDVLERRKR
ncbi:MAG: response regulator [Rhodospirillales bacterium]|nr:response regulator [Rhodospirillales bacterium]